MLVAGPVRTIQFLNEQMVQHASPLGFRIIIRRESRTAVFLQIAHALIEEIRRGRLAPGSALPGTRELAESLEVNRKTVVQAYAELDGAGLGHDRAHTRHLCLGASADVNGNRAAGRATRPERMPDNDRISAWSARRRPSR